MTPMEYQFVVCKLSCVFQKVLCNIIATELGLTWNGPSASMRHEETPRQEDHTTLQNND